MKQSYSGFYQHLEYSGVEISLTNGLIFRGDVTNWNLDSDYIVMLIYDGLQDYEVAIKKVHIVSIKHDNTPKNHIQLKGGI